MVDFFLRTSVYCWMQIQEFSVLFKYVCTAAALQNVKISQEILGTMKAVEILIIP